MRAQVAALIGACCSLTWAFDPGRLGFSVSYQDEKSSYRVNAVFLMPGETVNLKVQAADTGAFTLEDSAARGRPAGPPPTEFWGPHTKRL
jgi:hypothetical protein